MKSDTLAGTAICFFWQHIENAHAEGKEINFFLRDHPHLMTGAGQTKFPLTVKVVKETKKKEKSMKHNQRIQISELSDVKINFIFSISELPDGGKKPHTILGYTLQFISQHSCLQLLS